MRKYLYAFLLIFTIVTGFYFFLGWWQLPEGHRYIYPIDDVYIHLALARNFADYGIWSVNTSGFDSASSSILYTLLLTALIKVFGDWEYYPLIINVFFGYLTVYMVYRYFKENYGEREMKWAIVLLLPFSMLYFSALLGMEHTLHMFLITVAVYLIHQNVNSDFDRRDFLKMLAVVFFISVIRFESMFFTVSLALALSLRKEIWKSVLVLITGFLPIVIFGLISVKSGGYFFPNSVMIKGSYPSDEHFLYSIWNILEKGILLNSSFYKCLFFPFVIIVVYLINKYRKSKITVLFKSETLIITVVLMAILHSLFAFLKYRYENYVMIAVLLVIIPIIADFFKGFSFKNIKVNLPDLLMIGSVTVVILVSAYRFVYHHLPLKYSSKGINEQQIEMSRFLGEYYKGEKVLANDIGAISYFSHVQLLDMVGLGSTDIATIKINNKHHSRERYITENKKYITDYAKEKKCGIAVIYPEWFPGNPPANWIPVSSWTSSANYGPAISRIVFYALKTEEVAPLQRNLSKFNLDSNVKQWFYIYQK